MRRIKAFIWIPAASAAFMAIVAGAWFFGSSYDLMDTFEYKCAIMIEPMSTRKDVVQTFEAPEDNLSRIDVYLGIMGLSGDEQISFELYEVEGDPSAPGLQPLKKKVREASLKPELFFWMHRIGFEPIADSGGKTYAMKLKGTPSPGSDVRPWASGSDTYHGGTLYLDGIPTGRDLSFALFHEEGAGGIFDRLKPFRPFPLGSGVFFSLLLLTAGGAFGWLLRIIARSQS